MVHFYGTLFGYTFRVHFSFKRPQLPRYGGLVGIKSRNLGFLIVEKINSTFVNKIYNHEQIMQWIISRLCVAKKKTNIGSSSGRV